MADFGLYYHNFKYGHGNAKKVSVGWLHFKAELSFSRVNMKIHGRRLSSQGCVPVKRTAPEVPAKVMCMYIFKSNYNFIVLLVKA